MGKKKIINTGRGRPTYEEATGNTWMKIEKAYQLAGSTRGAAKLLGISHWTVRKYLIEHEVPMKPHGGKREHSPIETHRHRGCLAQWIKDHPKEKLPRSVAQIARLTGCSYESVKNYLIRRERYLNKVVKHLGIEATVNHKTLHILYNGKAYKNVKSLKEALKSSDQAESGQS